MKPLWFTILLFSTMSLEATELSGSRQCIAVVAKEWDASSGSLHLLGRATSAEPWRVVRGPVAVLLGRHGLAPGVGADIPGAPPGLRKKEGDGRTPAGIFALGTGFGFEPHPGKWLYRQLQPGAMAVDDPQSRYYTQLVDTSTVTDADWRTAEKMRAIPQYRLGLLVEYNTRQPVRGAGSCIFLHCYPAPRKATSGCTALPEADMAALLQWLDPAAKPRLLQLPERAFEELRSKLALPRLPGSSLILGVDRSSQRAGELR